MSRYRSKQIEVEAFQWDGQAPKDPVAHWPKWFIDALDEDRCYFVRSEFGPRIVVRTSEGAVQAKVNDWIVRNPQGEIHPFKPEIFSVSYEAAA